MQAFGFGATEKNHLIPQGKYTKIKSVLGEELTDAFCPECENYMNDYLDWIERVAKSGAKMIMIDDDLCLSVRPGLGCFCKNHIKILEDKLGEPLDGKDLTKLFFIIRLQINNFKCVLVILFDIDSELLEQLDNTRTV